MPEEKVVKLVYDVEPPITVIHLFMKGSGNPDDLHEIIGFHVYDKDGALVYGAGLKPEELDKVAPFASIEFSDN